MRKRKPPIILVTCLVLFGAVAFAFNYAASASQTDPQAPPKPAPAAAPVNAGQPRAPVDSKSIAQNVTGQMPGGGPKAMPGGPGMGPKAMMRGGPGKMGMMAGGQNTIAMPKPGNYKPTMSDSSINSQWYTSESPKPKTGS